MTVKICLIQGRIAIVDDDDANLVCQFRWHVTIDYATTYARRAARNPDGRRTTQLMHCLITGWVGIDHVNGDGLDNRRANLRPVTQQQNSWNQQKIHGASRFKGVTRASRGNRWHARIWLSGRNVHLGYFYDEELAALAYDAAARSHFGEYAALNFPLIGERAAAAPGIHHPRSTP